LLKLLGHPLVEQEGVLLILYIPESITRAIGAKEIEGGKLPHPEKCIE
jgi:hypothetical protein